MRFARVLGRQMYRRLGILQVSPFKMEVGAPFGASNSEPLLALSVQGTTREPEDAGHEIEIPRRCDLIEEVRAFLSSSVWVPGFLD